MSLDRPGFPFFIDGLWETGVRVPGNQDKPLYKVSFVSQGKVYELYARSVGQADLFGFIEIFELVFGEKSSILVDPAEDAMKLEFAQTERLFLPMHSILRIEQMQPNLDFKPRIVALPQKAGTQTTNTAEQAQISNLYRPAPKGRPDDQGC
ncbi:MAG: DUF1820 family protein [Leptospiraceae bacterium]|nr:DUF1820 family protein [Leptospiraceae bacterium]